MQNNQYVIYDAKKEKPSLRKWSGLSERVLGFFGGEYDKVFYEPQNNFWFRLSDGLRVTVTHWTDLPPDPPKPKRWVKKEIPIVWQDRLSGAYVLPILPKDIRDPVLTYEVEEEQP